MATPAAVKDLPLPVAQALADFVTASRDAFGDGLRAVVLYGSAAEGRLRATSDVNVILVLSSFGREDVDRLRGALQAAHAAVRLSPMFLLEGEIASAADAFAAKFSDVLRRRRVLFGHDPFAGLAVPRAAALARLKQSLLNLALRLRAAYALRSLREEQLARVVADAAGPLRANAATLLDLEGVRAPSPREALRTVAAASGEEELRRAMDRLSEARETGVLPPGEAAPTLFALIGLAERMRARAERLS
jgi:predicted nucleotidyltransferase